MFGFKRTNDKAQKLENFVRLSVKDMVSKVEIVNGIKQIDSNIDPLKLINDMTLTDEVRNHAYHLLSTVAIKHIDDINKLCDLFFDYNKYYNTTWDAKVFVIEYKYGKLELRSVYNESVGDRNNRYTSAIEDWISLALVKGASDEDILYYINNHEIIQMYQNVPVMEYSYLIRCGYACSINNFTRQVLYSLDYSDQQACDAQLNKFIIRVSPYVTKDTIESIYNEYKIMKAKHLVDR